MSLNCLTRPGTKTENLTKSKKQTPTKIWTKISETKISQTLPKQREETQEQPTLTKMIQTLQTNNTQSGNPMEHERFKGKL
jgi:hypothetical protein